MSKIRESARGEDCTVRIPYTCNHNSETTVLAHANGTAGGKGIGQKSIDELGAYACSCCHDVIDGRVPIPKGFSRLEIDLMFHEGHQRTYRILKRKGLV